MQRVIRSLLAWAILAGPAPALAAPLVPVGPVGFATDHFRLAGGPDGVFDVEGGALPPGVAWSTGCWAGGAGESLEGAEDGRPLTGVSASVSVMGMAGLSVQTSVALDGGGAGDTRVAPKLPRGLIHPPDGGIAGPRRTLRDRLFGEPWSAGLLGVDVVLPRVGAVDGRRVCRAHRRSHTVVPWLVDDPERMRALAELGVDGFLTDRPDLAVATLRRGSTPLEGA